MHVEAHSAEKVDNSASLPDAAQLELLDHLPVAVFLVDSSAVVRFANQQTIEMIGVDRDELIGRSVIEFVHVDDIEFAVNLLATGFGFDGQVMGPSRLRYVDTAGRDRWTQVWANVAPPELGDGFLLTLTDESVRDVLATALGSVVDDDELDRTLSAIAVSARAMPLCGRGAILVASASERDSNEGFRVVGDWPIDPTLIDAAGTPWQRSLAHDEAVDVHDLSCADLSAEVRCALVDIECGSLFIRPVRNTAGAVCGVLIVFRDETVGPASVNQDDHLVDMIGLASLAFTQAEQRRELRLAVHRDALTGVANRAAFDERIRTETHTCDALFVDLDHFKAVNDTFGHDVGDAVIAEAANRISETVRLGDVVYRPGGDEFVVICESSGSDSDARTLIADRIIESLGEPFEVGRHRVRIGATVGIAAGVPERHLDDVVRAADGALYVAKAGGRAGWAHADLDH